LSCWDGEHDYSELGQGKRMMVILKLTQEEHRELTRHYFVCGLAVGSGVGVIIVTALYVALKMFA